MSLLDLPVRGVMTAVPVTVSADESLTDVFTTMLNAGFHHMPVVDAGGKLVGILTAADLVGHLKAQDPEIRDTGVVLPVSGDDSVAAHMTRDPVTVTEDATLREVLQHFAEGRFHAVPVIDGDDGRLLGIVTTADLARFWLSRA